LLSGSKDTLLKVWDLEQQRCIETVVGHRAEVWGFAVTPDETRVVTISSAADLKVWALNVKGRGSGMEVDDADKEEGSGSGGNSAPTQGHLALMGPIRRVGMERGVAVQFSRNGMFMGCHGTGKVLEIYKRRSHEEVLKKIKRRLKRLREKKRKKNLGQGQDEGEQEGDEEDASLAQATTADEFALLGTIRSGSKIQAFDFAPAVANADTCKVLVSSMNNTLQEYVMDLSSKLTKKGALVVVFFCNLLRRQRHRLCWVW
jgi:U3 small nucleolar RNA-associated protein 12